MIVDVEVVLNYVIKNSRTRFLKELNPERPQDNAIAKSLIASKYDSPNMDPMKKGKATDMN